MRRAVAERTSGVVLWLAVEAAEAAALVGQANTAVAMGAFQRQGLLARRVVPTRVAAAVEEEVPPKGMQAVLVS